MNVKFELLETILYTPEEGFFLLEEHLDRILKAKRDFNRIDSTTFEKELTKADIIEQLYKKVPKDGSCYRVRMLVNVDSKVTIEHTMLPKPICAVSLESIENATPCYDIVLDTQPFSRAQDDPWVRHKTTFRDMYNEARERTQCDWHAQGQPFDVVLWNTHQEVTETSIANIAVRYNQDGKIVWKTPPVESGLLPGVFRDFLLKNTDCLLEERISINDLKQAQKVNLVHINSL
ncbi:aminotransferase [Sporodiniella umbellata]|nr:aminotransferase [Sporodiniella umbellata]